MSLKDNDFEDTPNEKNEKDSNYLTVAPIERKKSVVTFNEDVEEIQIRL